MRLMRRTLLLFLAITLLFGLFPGISASAEAVRAPLSRALSILAGGTDLALWGLVGETQILDSECFLRGLNLSRIDSVKICSIPDRAVGSLSFDRTPVQAGQVFSASELSRLSFEAASSKVGSTSFLFETNSCGVAYICRIYLLSSVNASPSLASVPTLLQSFTTHQNSARAGRFYAEDPEGDALAYEIASYPKYGSVRVLGSDYVYKPFSNYTGEDSFSFVARDLYGNYSSSMKISIHVTSLGADLVFSDISDSATESAVRTLASVGILGSEQVGSLNYFYPERQITRGEFLVSAMSAVGMSNLPECSYTGFADDDMIPNSMKPYVSVAYRLGYVSGKVKGGEVLFGPTDQITQGEAADLLERLILPDKAKTAVAVSGNLNETTRESVSALASLGVIQLSGEVYQADQILTRGEAAKLLEQVFFLTNSKKI